MRIFNLANRNFKEIIRDPLSIIFAIILPLFLLFIFQQFNIPAEIYKIENFTPGIIIFSLSFITLFTATLVAKDRSTSLLTRLGVSPIKPIEYVLGYALSVIPFVVIQNILFFIVAIFLGLKISVTIIYTILIVILISILFIGLGILIGSITTEKSASGVSSCVVQLVAFTSGMYFSTDMVGDFFKGFCKILPFESCLNITKGILNANFENIFSSIIRVLIYTTIIILASIIVFRMKIFNENN